MTVKHHIAGDPEFYLLVRNALQTAHIPFRSHVLALHVYAIECSSVRAPALRRIVDDAIRERVAQGHPPTEKNQKGTP